MPPMRFYKREAAAASCSPCGAGTFNNRTAQAERVGGSLGSGKMFFQGNPLRRSAPSAAPATLRPRAPRSALALKEKRPGGKTEGPETCKQSRCSACPLNEVAPAPGSASCSRSLQRGSGSTPSISMSPKPEAYSPIESLCLCVCVC